MERKHYFYISIGLALLLSFLFDQEVIKFVESIRFEYINTLFILLSSSYLLYSIPIIISILLYKKRHQILTLWTSVISTYLLVQLLKWFISRPRPEVSTLVEVTTSSLPSSHAAVIFALYPLISKELGMVKYHYLGLAVLIALSRLYNGVHFLSDIIIGTIIGYLIGLILLSLEEKYNYFEKLLNKYIIKPVL